MALLGQESQRRLAGSLRLFGILSLIAVPVGVLLAAFHAPLLSDRACSLGVADCITSPLGQKIFYFHVPVAFAAYAALTVLLVASLRALMRSDTAWDILAEASAEVGVLFAGLTLFSGILWGHLEWGETFGYWNNQDTKLVLTLVLFLLYTGYLVLRRQIDDPRRRMRVAAVYATLAFVTVPFSYMAQRVWASIHPTVFANPQQGTGLTTPGVETTFLANTAAFLVLAAFLIAARFRLGVRRHDAEEADA